jgi:DNA-binding transcriptional regulator YiaG
MMGVSVALVGGWERGTREPTNEQVKKIMAILQVTHEELGISDE